MLVWTMKDIAFSLSELLARHMVGLSMITNTKPRFNNLQRPKRSLITSKRNLNKIKHVVLKRQLSIGKLKKTNLEVIS